MSVLIALAVIAVIIIVLYLVSPFFYPKATKLDGSHVLVSVIVENWNMITLDLDLPVDYDLDQDKAKLVIDTVWLI